MKKFIIISFKNTPFGQAFRYKRNWFRKTYTMGGGGELLRKYSENMNDNSNVFPASITLIGPTELVATEESFLTKLQNYVDAD